MSELHFNLSVSVSRLESMEDGMLELEMAVPALQLDASATASLKKVNGFVLQLETAFNVPEASSLQKAILRYGNNIPYGLSIYNVRIEGCVFEASCVIYCFTDEDKIELEIKSDVNSEVTKLMPDMEDYRNQLQMLLDNVLDKKVAKTDMKLRHIVSKGIEVSVLKLYILFILRL